MISAQLTNCQTFSGDNSVMRITFVDAFSPQKEVEVAAVVFSIKDFVMFVLECNKILSEKYPAVLNALEQPIDCQSPYDSPH